MPVSWQIAPSTSEARSMFWAMIVNACDARPPAGSACSEVFIAARTSGGKSVDVLTISSKTLSKNDGSTREVYSRQVRGWRLEGKPLPEMKFRKEHDPLGELDVPADAYYGVQTMRAVSNFRISGLRAPADLVTATILIKKAAAEANASLGRLDSDIARAIV